MIANRISAGWTAFVLGALGVTYRLVLLLVEVPPTNSDEATSGLVALHLAQGRELPLFFYGQYYMGALESYLAAPLFLVANPGLVALRLPNLLLYAAFLTLMWHLTRRLYTPWLATLTVGLLTLGSDRILKNQLIAGGGYPEMNPAGALLMLLAVNLGLGVVRRRMFGYAGWGLVAGLTLWDDWLVLPYVGAAGLLLLAGNWRQLRGQAGRIGRGVVALIVGLSVGLIPIVWHNLTAAPANGSLAIYRNLAGHDPASWPDRLHGGVLLGVPMGTGLCHPGRCTSWQMTWGIVGPLLLALVGVLAVRALRASDNHTERIRHGGRLALVCAAVLSLLAYVPSAAAGNTPVESARYLSCLLISAPAVLWPLWSALTGRAASVNRPVRLAAGAGLTAVALTAIAATLALLAQVPQYRAEADRRRELVVTLDQLGIAHFYTEYWTCNTIIFASRERLICAVLGDDLRPGWDRYPAYAQQVGQASRPAYVLPSGSGLSKAVAAYLRDSGVPVTQLRCAGYDIYQAAHPVRPPLG